MDTIETDSMNDMLNRYFELTGTKPEEWLRCEVLDHIEYIEEDSTINPEWYGNPYGKTKEQQIEDVNNAAKGDIASMLAFLDTILGAGLTQRLGSDIATAEDKN